MEIIFHEIQNCAMEETWQTRARRVMKEKRISQEKLAEDLSMSQTGISSWLRGITQPSLADINRIADAIGVSHVWLTHGLGPESTAGKQLVELLLGNRLEEGQLEALAITARALAGCNAPPISSRSDPPAKQRAA